MLVWKKYKPFRFNHRGPLLFVDFASLAKMALDVINVTAEVVTFKYKINKQQSKQSYDFRKYFRRTNTNLSPTASKIPWVRQQIYAYTPPTLQLLTSLLYSHKLNIQLLYSGVNTKLRLSFNNLNVNWNSYSYVFNNFTSSCVVLLCIRLISVQFCLPDRTNIIHIVFVNPELFYFMRLYVGNYLANKEIFHTKVVGNCLLYNFDLRYFNRGTDNKGDIVE